MRKKKKKLIPLKEIREHYIFLSEAVKTMQQQNLELLQRIGASMDDIGSRLTANQIGLANCYKEFKISQEKIRAKRKAG